MWRDRRTDKQTGRRTDRQAGRHGEANNSFLQNCERALKRRQIFEEARHPQKENGFWNKSYFYFRWGSGSCKNSSRATNAAGTATKYIGRSRSKPWETEFLAFVLTSVYKTNLMHLLTPWCRVLLEQLTGLQLVKKFPHFTEPERSLPHSQASATCLYPGPAQSSPHTHISPPGDHS